MIARQVILQFDSYHSQSVQVSPTPDEDSSNSNECPWNRSTIGQCGVWDLYVELRITPLKPMVLLVCSGQIVLGRRSRNCERLMLINCKQLKRREENHLAQLRTGSIRTSKFRSWLGSKLTLKHVARIPNTTPAPREVIQWRSAQFR